jgi:hypothetical protein
MPQHMSLSESTLAALDIAPISSSANVNGTVMDMQGWDGIQYAFQLGTMASGATYDARIVSSANANMSGATNVTNAALTQVAVTGNANIYIIDVWRPTDRYLRSATQPATANSQFAHVDRDPLSPEWDSASHAVASKPCRSSKSLRTRISASCGGILHGGDL